MDINNKTLSIYIHNCKQLKLCEYMIPEILQVKQMTDNYYTHRYP